MGSEQWAVCSKKKGSKQKAESRKLSAFCFLPTAHCSLFFCFLPERFQFLERSFVKRLLTLA